MRAPAGGAAPSRTRGGAAGRRRGGRAPWRSGARRASGTRSAAARVARTRSTAAGPCRPPRGSACRRRRRRSSGTWARAKRVDAKGRRRAAGRREKGRGGGVSERRVAWTRRRGALLVEDLVAPSAEEHRGVVDGVRRARPRRSVLFGPAASARTRRMSRRAFAGSCPHRAPDGAARPPGLVRLGELRRAAVPYPPPPRHGTAALRPSAPLLRRGARRVVAGRGPRRAHRGAAQRRRRSGRADGTAGSASTAPSCSGGRGTRARTRRCTPATCSAARARSCASS